MARRRWRGDDGEETMTRAKFLLIVDGLQTFDVLPSSTGNFLLIVDGLQTFDVLPSSTGNFLLIVDGLQTFDVLPSSIGDSSTHRGRTADHLICCPTGAPNFLRSIDASAIFLRKDSSLPKYCGLSFRKIGSRVGRNQTIVMRIYDRWMQVGTTDRPGRSHSPQCTTSREDRQIVHMAVTDCSVTSRTIAQHIESVTHHSVSDVPFDAFYSRVVCPYDVHCLVYP
ncbi:transposable element Tcb1 transposase [Trichonephila clavipes]|nr:transposable element Tcb1 transposase [Trichonephila clavipes]